MADKFEKIRSIKNEMRCFLSHNKADRETARSISAHLLLTGLDVWFDEWEIQAGESIPGKLDEGLAAFDTFVLIWSANANRSKWVREELSSAIMRATAENSAKIIPCMLDETPLPPLISHRRGVDFSDRRKGIAALLDDLTGTRSRRLRLLAIQGALEEMDVQWVTHPTLPPMVCCPKCGETESLTPWQDSNQHGQYAGMRCANCKWSGGGEV